MENQKVPQHFRFIIPIIDVLKELGGSGRASEVTDLVVSKCNISEEELSETIKSGASRVINQMHWARALLVRLGYLDKSQHGVWNLTDKGFKTEITPDNLPEIYKIRKKLGKQFREAQRKAKTEKEPEVTEQETETPEHEGGTEITDYTEELLDILKSLPAAGFERICQRLLRESGFDQVTVTGKSGDGGIDGHGILQMNPFVSFKVMFQSKRYQGSVAPSQVRDFRGAVMGRADKGIIITTGTFTMEAKREARREGVPPIELVDGEKLIEMFEFLELGLKPKKTYDVDYGFFEEFRS